MKTFFAILLAVIIFIGFSLYSYSEICCMFSASRYYGFPYPYLVLNKSVETYAEAERVKTDSTSVLIHAGWKLNFGTHITQGALGSPVLSLLADLAISFALAFALFFSFGKLRKT
jgi:hypothetical protein